MTRGETLRRSLGIEDGKGTILEVSSDRTSMEVHDEPGGEKIKSEFMDSVGNKADGIGGSDNCLESLKYSDELKEGAKEKVLQSRLDRKRSMEIGDDEFSRKKIKAEIVDSPEKQNEKTEERNEFSRKKIKAEIVDSHEKQTEKTGRNKNSTIDMKHRDRCMGSGKDGVQGSELLIRGAKLRNGDKLIERKLQPTPKRRRKAEAENGRWLGRSGQRELLKLKGATVKEDNDGGSPQHNYAMMQGKSSVLRVLHSSKKDDDLHNSSVQYEEHGKSRRLRSEEHGKSRRLRSPSMDKFNKSDHQFERQISEKPISTIKLGKRKGKVSSEDTIGSNVVKINGKCISQKKGSKNVSLFHGKSVRPAKVERHTKESDGSRSAVKNRLREQIKNILLDAGWRIELRPRRGRSYEDSVYVSPKGTGYWSITKAYDVYIRQFDDKSNDKDSSGKQSKASAGRDSNNCEGANSTPAVIPPEVLHILKRKVVNKRRRRIEAKETQIKLGVGRRKMVKETTKKRSSRDDVGGARAIKRKVIVRNSKRGGCALLVRGSSQVEGSENTDYAPYVWKRTILSWMIDLGVLPAYGKVRCMNKRMTKTLLDGRITRDGLQCGCCSKILTISKFAAHAGCKPHQPYENIYVEVSGISILQCQINAWEKHEDSKEHNFYDVDTEGDDPNDDTCGICGDGGDLICCDGCPSTFHLGCLGIQMLPTGDWHCTNCSCKFCGAAYDSSCHDGSASDTLLTCSQCARKYHKDCVPKDDTVSAVPNGSYKMFCGWSCRKVFRQLQKLTGDKNELDAGFSWSIIRRFNNPSKSPSKLAERVECNSKIAVAYAVMDECFVRITDLRSGINLIHNVVYNCGSNFNRLNFMGFYTFILERGDEIVAAASIRIHGRRLAEMPFIGTRSIYRRQGMCRRLLKGIESALRSLCIEKLIIPAISELMDTWTNVFGFKPLGISQKQELKSVNMLVFPGTGLLQKSLLKDSTKRHINPKQEETPETQIYEKADLNCSAEEAIHSKESKSDAEGTEATMPDLENSTSNLLPEASGFHAPFCRSSDSAADAESDDLEKVVSHNSYVEEEAPLNCSNKASVCIEETKNVVEDVKGTLHFQHSASEFLQGAAYGFQASESRPQKNDSNMELSITDAIRNYSFEKEDEYPLVSLKKRKTEPASNGIAHDVHPKKVEHTEADEDTAHVNNVVKHTEANDESDGDTMHVDNVVKHTEANEDVKDTLHFQHPATEADEDTMLVNNVVRHTEPNEDVKDTLHCASEFLQGSAYGFQASESRPQENDSNLKLSITDAIRNYSSEKDGEYPLAFLKKCKTEPASNGIAHDVHHKKVEHTEADEDTTQVNNVVKHTEASGEVDEDTTHVNNVVKHTEANEDVKDIHHFQHPATEAHDVHHKKVEHTEADEDTMHVNNVVKLGHDANGLESNVNEDGVEVSVYVRSHLSVSPGKNSWTSAGVCENGSGLNHEHNNRASNESTSQENHELLQKHLKCFVEDKDRVPFDQLAVSDSVKSLDVVNVCDLVGTNPSTSECALNKLIDLTTGVNQFVATASEESDVYH